MRTPVLPRPPLYIVSPMSCLLAPLTLPLLNPPPHKPSPPLQDPNEEKDAINSIAPLCLEATTVNQNFSQQVWGQAVCGVCVWGGGGQQRLYGL